MSKTLDLSPFARAALREPIIRALDLGAKQLHASLNAVGRRESGPWTVRVWSKARIVEHRGWDLEALCFMALELFAKGVDTTTHAWRAGADGLAHGHAKGRTSWTLCRQPAIDERFGHPEHARCYACLLTLAQPALRDGGRGMSEQLELRVWALGSTDAADAAKREARSQGYRIQTVASIRPAPGSESIVDLSRTSAYWLVTLAVVRPTSAMSEATLVAGYGGLPGEAPIAD